MGVYVSPTIVKRDNDKVTLVNEPGMPQSKPIYALNDLVFLDELKTSLFKIAKETIDLSFFTKPNSYTYGDTENVNTSFTPKEVLKCINSISEAFKKNEGQFIRSSEFQGVYDENGKQLREAFIEIKEWKFFWKKKTDKWGRFHAKRNNASFQWYDDKKEKWGAKVDLTREHPTLFELSYDGQKKIKGKKLKYKAKRLGFFDKIKPELDNIELLANYANEKGYELQIVHG